MDKLFKESMQALEDMLRATPKYQREACKECDHILACAGECEKTKQGGNV